MEHRQLRQDQTTGGGTATAVCRSPAATGPLPSCTDTDSGTSPSRRRALDELSWYFGCGAAALGFAAIDPFAEVHTPGSNSVEASLVGMVDGGSNGIRRNRDTFNRLSRCSFASRRILELCFTVPAGRIHLLQHLMMNKRVYKRPVSACTASKRASARWHRMAREGYNLQPLVALDCVVDEGRFTAALAAASERFEGALAEYQRSLPGGDT